MELENEKISQTLTNVQDYLSSQRCPAGFWPGELSSSALSTATSVFALWMVQPHKHKSLIENGLDWLSHNTNPDSAWGDTVKSKSNISTTLLCLSAFSAAKDPNKYSKVISDAKKWITACAGSLDTHSICTAVEKIYDPDKTFSIPILTMCALAGTLGPGKKVWNHIKPLPFELAALPPALYKFLGLRVVSYALPALIAIGQVNCHYNKPSNPVIRLLRKLTRRKTLQVLEDTQPQTGGFLEAAPLTSFVVMSLAACGKKDHVVVKKGIDFLVNSVRPDGSWPIDTDLATWLTTLTVNALGAESQHDFLSIDDKQKIQTWLLSQQNKQIHPFTRAEPGGWGWTDKSGAVPDADDTAGALIALHELNLIDDNVINAAHNGVTWLLNLQNRDGGIPTFCKGWGKLPFDRSAPDLTAHAIAAWSTWLDKLKDSQHHKTQKAISRAITFLKNTQKKDGSWTPLWFGNESAPAQQNPVYGTAKVLTYLCLLQPNLLTARFKIITKALGYLVSVQNEDGSFGGAEAIKSSVEETAVAVEALASVALILKVDKSLQQNLTLIEEIDSSLTRGAHRLIEMTNQGKHASPAPIGLYFAKLWYYEKLYPWIFTVAALRKVSDYLKRPTNN